MDQIVRCDNCSKTFKLKQINLQEKYLGAMYVETFFNTPCCNHKHLVCIKDTKCRELEDKLKNKSLELLESNVDIVKANEELNNIQKEYKGHMDLINGKV